MPSGRPPRGWYADRYEEIEAELLADKTLGLADEPDLDLIPAIVQQRFHMAREEAVWIKVRASSDPKLARLLLEVYRCGNATVHGHIEKTLGVREISRAHTRRAGQRRRR